MVTRRMCHGSRHGSAVRSCRSGGTTPRFTQPRYFLFKDKWVGTALDFAVAFFWAYASDIGSDAATASARRLKKLRGCVERGVVPPDLQLRTATRGATPGTFGA